MKTQGIILISLIMLSGCSTPQTTLRNPHNGDVVTCGGSSVGSVLGGMIGYSIQKDHDQDCVNEHRGSGYAIIKHSDD